MSRSLLASSSVATAKALIDRFEEIGLAKVCFREAISRSAMTAMGRLLPNAAHLANYSQAAVVDTQQAVTYRCKCCHS